ncbi:MAG: LCP family protein [Promicromonosporaceae bacterium]|nr:LCP family protein [Promicromonosporaceae bacterium]
MTDPRQVPPSFTPSGRSGRPPEPGNAIPVGGARPAAGGRIGRPDDDAVPASAEPRVRRQSSREIPVTPPADRRGIPVRPARQPAPRPSAVRPASARPQSVPPRSAAPSSDRVPPPAPAGARDGGTRLMPDAAPRRITGSASGSRGGRPPARRADGRPDLGSPAGPRPTGQRTAPGRLRVRKGRVIALITALVLVLVLAWPVGLLIWANGKIQHVDALSDAAATPGTTYLLAGSDARGSGGIDDATSGARTDTIMLLHKPANGPTALISLPRDSFVAIPGHGHNKLNAAFSFGGAPLLVKTVEQLTGLKVDHYVEVGFGGIADVVDAVGGVHLCLDYDVNDANSGLQWTAGCHDVGGTQAIAFSRMRYSDPKGDIGRTERQRQLIGAITKKVANPGLLFNPGDQVSLTRAGLGSLTVDKDMNILDFVGLGLAFRAANGAGGVTGTPWISSMNYRPGGGVGSTVRLDDARNAQLWADLRDGKLQPGTIGGVPQ